jgi:hypothetical protein
MGRTKKNPVAFDLTWKEAVVRCMTNDLLCTCSETLSTLEELRQHWSEGHFKGVNQVCFGL